jgi:hypothetical protein
MKDKQETIFSLKPGDTIVQIIPEWLQTNSTEVILPDLSAGYTIPLRKFLLEKFGSEFCGIMEVESFFINTKINKDLIEELYENNTHFDIYIRQKHIDCCPKVLKIFKDCTLYQQEFAIPEVPETIFNRYYFTNSKEPWDIPESKLDNLIPVNQYIYDYAVSKAIKDLNKDLKETVNNTVKKIFDEARL